MTLVSGSPASLAQPLGGLARLPLQRKILVGFVALLGVSSVGPILGAGLANHLHQEVLAQAQRIQTQDEVAQKLHSHLLHFQLHYHKLPQFLKNPQLLRADSPQGQAMREAFLEDYAELENDGDVVRADLVRFGPQSPPELKPVADLVGANYAQLQQYLARFDGLVEEIPLSNEHLKSDRAEADLYRLRQRLEGLWLPEDSQILHRLIDQLDTLMEELENQRGTINLKSLHIQNLQLSLALVSLGLSLAVALWLARVISRHIARPIEETIAQAHHIAETGQLTQRVASVASVEGERLAAAVNHLLDQLAALLAEQKNQASDRLLQHEKLAELGRLMAGVAHEINNPLNFTLGNLHHTRDYTDQLLKLVDLYAAVLPEIPVEVQDHCEDCEMEFLREDLPKVLASMELGLSRMRAIVQSLKDFARLDTSDPQPVDLKACLDSTLTILHSRLKQGIVVERHYGELPPLLGFPGALCQVFMNVIGNAIDALQPATTASQEAVFEACSLPRNPRITITTSVAEDGWIQVCLGDNGCGMPPEVRSHIFETFYTTKPRGVGTGLGLAIAWEIVVQKHGGRLLCESAPGQGTTFILELPPAPLPPASESGASAAVPAKLAA